jgi:hypothetical protein
MNMNAQTQPLIKAGVEYVDENEDERKYNRKTFHYK